MNKLTAEKCREPFEKWFRDVEAGDDPNWSSPPYLSREWHDYLARRQLALGAWNKALELSHTVPALKLPEKVSCDGFNPKEWDEARNLGQCEGWNACIYELKRLNGVTE